MKRIEIIVIILAVLALTSAGVSWYRDQHPLLTSKTEYVSVPQIKTVTQIKRISVPVERVITIEKPVIVEKLKLPEAIAKDENKQITTTGEVAPYEGKTNVVAVLDTKSGESQIIAKQVPLPFFDFVNKKEIGLRYGYGTASKMNMEADIYGRWDFLRVGSVHLGVYGEVSTNGDARAMISAGYRW